MQGRKRKANGPVGNRRRHPRPQPVEDVRSDQRLRVATGSRIDSPHDGRPGILRRIARWTVRLGLAGGLAYGVLVGAREGYEYATTSPRFEVRGLLFEASEHVDDARLRELMAIEPGTNILAVDLDAVATRITSDPWVARATVTRVLPDTLQVAVEEHEPVAVLHSGTFYLVNEEGLPFKPLDPGERGELPIITGVPQSELFIAPERAQASVGRALETLAAYAQKRRPRLSEINVDASGAVTLYTAELGSQLRLGRGDVSDALARYDALRAALGEESDKLAVAHLDASAAPETNDRVVASFFPTKDVPGFVTAAEERTTAEARRREEAEEAAAQANKKGKGALPGKKKSKLPSYE
jgi:cell division protein FtsQ